MDRLFGKRLHRAVKDNDVKSVMRCLDDGEDVNIRDRDGETPLLQACANGHREIAEILLSHGADINARNNFGKTALHQASSREVAELLISRGLGVHVRCKSGRTPLHEATKKGVAEFLVSQGADLKARDSDGRTPLDYVRFQGHRDVIDFLAELEPGRGSHEDA